MMKSISKPLPTIRIGWSLITVAVIALITIVFIVRVESHINGATPAACLNMTPGHGFQPKDGQIAPYTLTVSAPAILSGGIVLVNLAVVSEENLIAGLLVEARRRVDIDRQALGRFLVAHDDPVVHTINCGVDVEVNGLYTPS